MNIEKFRDILDFCRNSPMPIGENKQGIHYLTTDAFSNLSIYSSLVTVDPKKIVGRRVLDVQNIEDTLYYFVEHERIFDNTFNKNEYYDFEFARMAIYVMNINTEREKIKFTGVFNDYVNTNPYVKTLQWFEKTKFRIMLTEG